MRAQVRPRSSQVPSPIEGIFAPLASTKCIGALCRAKAVLPSRAQSGFGQRREHGFRRMSDYSEQRPCGPPRHALALLPVADGFYRHAKPCREFLLCQARPPTQVAHFRPASIQSGCKSIAREWELLPVPQFDDPSIRLQSQALHGPPPVAPASSVKPIKAQLTIGAKRQCTYFRPNQTVAMPRKEKNPTTSVIVVT